MSSRRYQYRCDATSARKASGTVVSVTLADSVGKLERDLIQDALKTARGNRAKAARLLGSTERVMNYKIRKYNVDCARFRRGRQHASLSRCS